MRLLVVSGSRADWGPLEWPVKVLSEDAAFTVTVRKIWGAAPDLAYIEVSAQLFREHADAVLLLGDRHEILAAALAAHLARVPIAHIGGGDVSEGSYDDAMRDCVSRLASIHFTASHEAQARLVARGYRNVHMTGSPGVDYIILLHADWKRARPLAEPYVVVSYQAETIDGTVDLDAVHAAIAGRKAVWISPNPDRGSERIQQGETYGHAEFLNLLAHCEEFIGNSSAIFYEAPFLKPGGVPCRLIGKRQRGRVVSFGDGKASKRIRDALKAWTP